MNLQESRSRTAAQLAAGPLDVLVIGGGIVARESPAMRPCGGCAWVWSSSTIWLSAPAAGPAAFCTAACGICAGTHRAGLGSQPGEMHFAPHCPAPGRSFALPISDLPRHKVAAVEAARRRQALRPALRPGNLGPSGSMSRRQVLDRIPGLCAEKLTGAVRYYDGLTSDARLVIDTLRSAVAGGAMIANYVRWERAAPIASGWRSEIRDLLSDRAFAIESRTVVNATGPWAENPPQSSVRLRATKGVHLVIDRGRLPVPDAVVMAEGGRIPLRYSLGKARHPRNDRHRLRRLPRIGAARSRPTWSTFSQSSIGHSHLLGCQRTTYGARGPACDRSSPTLMAAPPIFPVRTKSACPNRGGSTCPAAN